MPSTTAASAPAASTRLASFTFGTTGTTLTPAFLNFSKNGTGFPAPSVTKAGFSRQMTSTISSLFGAISMTLTPKGLSVSSRAFPISAAVHSVERPPVAITPAPPAFDTAATSFASEIQAIAPWMIGYFIPKTSVMLFAISYPPFKKSRTAFPSDAKSHQSPFFCPRGNKSFYLIL